jgi:hypothetical protein
VQPTTQVVVVQTSQQQATQATSTAAAAVVQNSPASSVVKTSAAVVAPTTLVTQTQTQANGATTQTSLLTSTAAASSNTSYRPETLTGAANKPASATSAASSSSSSASPSISGSQVATAVGVVGGIAGGIAALVIGICIYKRRRRKSIQRLGSSEDIVRPGQSPPLLNRSRTQNRPRRAIDDDDDDFLTPMDTLPNTHRMSQYGTGQHDHTAMYFEDSAPEHPYDTGNPYSSPEDAHHDPFAQGYDAKYDNGYGASHDAHQQPLNDYPTHPPTAVVPQNGRYFAGEMDRVGTPQSSGGAASSQAIPSYSAMNKYTAYTPPAPAQASNTGNYANRPGAASYRGPGGVDSGGYGM